MQLNDKIQQYDKLINSHITSYALALQRPQDFMEFYGMKMLFSDIDYPDKTKSVKGASVKEQIKLYKNVTKEKIEKLIKKLFVPENANLFVYGTKPSKNIGKILKTLKKK